MPVVTIRPSDGGRLITRASAADAGIPHYTRKLNCRRDLTDEIRREGWDYFNPMPQESDYQTHPFPGPDGEPITLIHHVRRPNGQAAIIIGTKTTLYRFNGVMEGYMAYPPLYVDGYVDDPDLIFQPYFFDPTRWQVIGEGFSANGKRWETVDIDGTTIFNNSADLPVAYRVEWEHTIPLYELREQGIICVGTISEINGALILADITELEQEDYAAVLNVKRSGDIKVWQNGYRATPDNVWATSDGTTVESNVDFFTSFDNGRLLVWSDGKKQRITAFIDARHVTVQAGDSVPLGLSLYLTDTPGSAAWEALAIRAEAPFFTSDMEGKLIGFSSGSLRRIVKVYTSQLASTDMDSPVPESEAFVENPITYLSKEQLESAIPGITFDRRQYRIIWSELGKPTRFAISIPVTFTSGSQLAVTERMNHSIKAGDAIVAIGAGTDGGVLQDITAAVVAPGVIILSAPALTGGAGSVQRLEAYGSIVGFHDVQDDGAAVLKMAPLRTRLVVYTDTNIFLGRYTGEPAAPFVFERIKVEHGRSIYFRNTLISVQDSYHVYAGKTAFYQFDLTSEQPVPVPDLDMLSNLFFDFARIEDTETIYSSDNKNTQEIWFVCPKNTADPIISYDYTYRTFSTVDYPFTAAASVKGAWNDLTGETGDWFLMGTRSGTLLQYGLSTEPVAAWPIVDPWDDGRRIYYRRWHRPYNTTKEGYLSILSAGMIHFGDAFNEKHVRSYLIECSSRQIPSSILAVKFYTALNEAGPETLFGSMDIIDSDNHGLIPLHTICHFIRDEIVINVPHPIRIHQRTWEFRGKLSKSTYRRP